MRIFKSLNYIDPKHLHFNLLILIVKYIRLIYFHFKLRYYLMYLQAIILIIHIILNQYIFYSMQVQFDVAMDLINFIQLKTLKLFHNYSF